MQVILITYQQFMRLYMWLCLYMRMTKVCILIKSYPNLSIVTFLLQYSDDKPSLWFIQV